MKDFIRILRRFVPPYKKYMVSNIVFNILSAILNLFSFALIIPDIEYIVQTEMMFIPIKPGCLIPGPGKAGKVLPN